MLVERMQSQHLVAGIGLDQRNFTFLVLDRCLVKWKPRQCRRKLGGEAAAASGKREIGFDGAKCRATISLGVATTTDWEKMTVTEFIHRLNRAKQEGRNQVVA